MTNSTAFSCFIIGEGTLPIQCADILLKHGHTICGIISPDPEVQRWASERQVRHSHPQDNLLGLMGQQPFDYLFSIVNPAILPAEILALPRKTAINYHDAPLPKYAGISATFWALIHREAAHGITWHEMSIQVDAGKILKQRIVEIAPHETTFTLNAKCYEAAIQAFAELVEDLAADRTTPIQQNLAERSFFPQSRRPEMGSVISWQQPAEAIDTFVRALDFGPYPNPKGLPKLVIGSEFLIIGELQVLGTRSTAAPGTITRIDREVIQIATTTAEIAVRKLRAIDGQELPLVKAAATYGLRQGDQLPELAPELAERLTTLDAAIGRHEGFWAERLAALQPIGLPFVERQAPGVASKAAQMPIPDAVGSYLASSRQDFKAFLRTAFVAYLARIAGLNQFDLGFSSAALRRELGELDRFFASTLPLRAELLPGGSYDDLAQALDAQLAGVEQYQTYARDLTLRYPVLRTLAEQGGVTLPVVVVEAADLDAALPPADLILAIGESDMTCAWVYNPAVLDPETVERMQRQFAVLVQSLATDPAQPIADLPLLGEAERRQILHDWNATAADYPQVCVHDLIAAQAARTPTAPAVVCGEHQLSYQDLDQRANQLAHHLRALGVGPEHVVALLLPRTPDFVIATLAVLKAEAAYLPLDEAYPAERLAFMVADAKAAVLLTHTDLLPLAPEFAGHSLPLDLAWSAAGTLSAQPTTPPPSRVTADNLAYLIYTSGSTGQPKGVAVPHRGLCNLVAWHQQRYALAPQDRTSLLASLAFDAAVWELWPPLAAGASLHLPPDALRAAPAALGEWLRQEQITIAFLPTPLAEAILAETTANALPLRALLTGGDRLHSQDLRNLPYPLVNHYGPTENSVVATCAAVSPDSTSLPPIGQPIANTAVYLLDARMQPLPIGMVGEIYIGGEGLARGYHDRPALTAEKFLPDPFGGKPGARLYRTGDLARYRADGQIEFVGRVDQQVKIRGFRIELGEIEAVLLRHTGVEQAVVMVHADQAGGQRLIGYVVKRQGATHAEVVRADLHAFLQTQLPAYMVPATILLLDDLPLTPNGKIDRKALSKINWAETSRRRSFVAPRTPLEEALLTIWQEACKLSQMSVDDNFFELGGNSLGATQIVSRVQQAFKAHLTVRDIFAAPTVEALARYLLLHEREPGHMDKIAIALKRVWSMSPEERQRALQQKKAK